MLKNRGNDNDDVELDSLSVTDNDGSIAGKNKNYLRKLACEKFGRVGACATFLVLVCLASGLSAVLVASRSRDVAPSGFP